MSIEQTQIKRSKVAWGITGGGDKIAEFTEIMKNLKEQYANTVEIQVFLSKAAETVLKFYNLEKELRQNFPKIAVEINSNSPFLAAWLQMRKFDFLLIAPATSNTVAKIANGIGDSMLSNAAIMSLKAFVPVYVVPTDFREKVVYTKLPNGKEMKLRIRKEDAEHTRKLEQMEDVFVLESPQKISDVFKERFGQR
jgi:archaeoflavoprotein AfpA